MSTHFEKSMEVLPFSPWVVYVYYVDISLLTLWGWVNDRLMCFSPPDELAFVCS